MVDSVGGGVRSRWRFHSIARLPERLGGTRCALSDRAINVTQAMGGGKMFVCMAAMRAEHDRAPTCGRASTIRHDGKATPTPVEAGYPLAATHPSQICMPSFEHPYLYLSL